MYRLDKILMTIVFIFTSLISLFLVFSVTNSDPHTILTIFSMTLIVPVVSHIEITVDFPVKQKRYIIISYSLMVMFALIAIFTKNTELIRHILMGLSTLIYIVVTGIITRGYWKVKVAFDYAQRLNIKITKENQTKIITYVDHKHMGFMIILIEVMIATILIMSVDKLFVNASLYAYILALIVITCINVFITYVDTKVLGVRFILKQTILSAIISISTVSYIYLLKQSVFSLYLVCVAVYGYLIYASLAKTIKRASLKFYEVLETGADVL